MKTKKEESSAYYFRHLPTEAQVEELRKKIQTSMRWYEALEWARGTGRPVRPVTWHDGQHIVFKDGMFRTCLCGQLARQYSPTFMELDANWTTYLPKAEDSLCKHKNAGNGEGGINNA